jgi:hypothetical protein
MRSAHFTSTKYRMFYKLHLKVGLEESIVNAPLVSLHGKKH